MQHHEATITVKKIEPSTTGKTLRITDERGDMWSLFPADRPFYDEGGKYKVAYTSNEFPPGSGKLYKTLKGTPQILEAPSKANGASGFPGTPAMVVRGPDPGPHAGMWEKEASRLLEAGMSYEAVVIHGITSRQAAYEILKTDIHGKLPEPRLAQESDDLEF